MYSGFFDFTSTVWFIDVGSDVSVLEVQNGEKVKNCWQWAWLQIEDANGNLFETWYKKIEDPGVCVCVACGRTIAYVSAGKKASVSLFQG